MRCITMEYITSPLNAAPLLEYHTLAALRHLTAPIQNPPDNNSPGLTSAAMIKHANPLIAKPFHAPPELTSTAEPPPPCQVHSPSSAILRV
jgi:hypothetical protein